MINKILILFFIAFSANLALAGSKVMYKEKEVYSACPFVWGCGLVDPRVIEYCEITETGLVSSSSFYTQNVVVGFPTNSTKYQMTDAELSDFLHLRAEMLSSEYQAESEEDSQINGGTVTLFGVSYQSRRYASIKGNDGKFIDIYTSSAVEPGMKETAEVTNFVEFVHGFCK